MTIRRVAVVQRDVNTAGSLARDAYLLVRELLARGVEVHVYCDPQRRTSALADAIFHDVRPPARSDGRFGGALQLAGFALAATRAVRADRQRLAFDIVDVNGLAGIEHDVVRVHEVVRAARRAWPDEGGLGYRFAHARAFAAPVVRPRIAAALVLERLQARPGQFARMAAVTDEVRDDLVETLGVPAALVDVVPLAFDLEPVPTDARADVRGRLGIAADDRVLLFVGHAFRRKGLVEAIDALPSLPADVHLIAVGGATDGERHAAVRAAAAAGAERRVHLVGADAPAPYYAASDVFVLPTTHDVWGVPVIEAMAAGIPVVTTRAAGSATELERAGAGIVVDRANGDFRAAVASLVADPARRSELGDRGRRAARAYTPRARVEQTLALYERVAAERRVTRIASFPAVQRMNPYQQLLYEHLRQRSFELEPSSRLTARWLIRMRRRVGVIHVHWPEGLYTLQRGAPVVRRLGSWAKVGLFAARLATARALGYRIVWTVHQVAPHQSVSRRLDRLGARILARAAHVLIAHDAATRERAVPVLGRRTAARLAVVAHGSYVGVYPAGATRAEVRRELDVPEGAFVFLSFGELRAHKCWRLLLRAFRGVTRPDLVLVIAGLVRDPSVRAELVEAASGDARIRLLLDYVDESRVAELFGAADAAVVARDDGGTSGSLILPLSLGVPVVAADRPAYREITGGEQAGWLFRPGDDRSLRDTLERAAADEGEALRRGDAALERARRMSWTPLAERVATLLRESGA